MTSVMLATYPEVFAGGAVIAGLPFGIASNVREALSGMMQSPSRPADELGDLVRNASKHKGPWPKVSVWHGSADRTVNPANADEIVKQWLDRARPAARRRCRSVKSTAIPATSGGMPMARPSSNPTPSPTWPTARRSALAGNDEPYGAEGAFLIEAGISSSYHIANFFGLTERIRQRQGRQQAAPKTRQRPRRESRRARHRDDRSGARAGAGSRDRAMAAGQSRFARPADAARPSVAASMSAASSPAR